MVTYLLYIGSTLGALTAIIGFFTLISKPFRLIFKKYISKILSAKDDENTLEKLFKMNEKQNDILEKQSLILEKQSEGIKCSLRHNIMDIYEKWIDESSVPEHIKEDLTEAYDSYTALKGNHHAKNCYNEIIAKPTTVIKFKY